MGHPIRHLADEVAKFLAVGGVATVVAFVLFNGLVHGFVGGGPGPMYHDPLAAFTIANIIGMLVSYRGTRSWAFRHREVVGLAGGRVAFFGISIASMLIPLACLTISRYAFGLDSALADNIAANVIGLAAGTLTRFLAYRTWIFKRAAAPEGALG